MSSHSVVIERLIAHDAMHSMLTDLKCSNIVGVVLPSLKLIETCYL